MSQQKSKSKDNTFITEDLKILPLSKLMATEVIGVDLRKLLNETNKARIHTAFLKYQLLVFRNQDLNKSEQVSFTEQFGTLERHTLTN